MLFLLILVEGKVDGTNKDANVGPTSSFSLVRRMKRSVVASLQASRVGSAVRGHDGDAGDPPGLALEVTARGLGKQTLSRGGTFRTCPRLAPPLWTALFDLVGQCLCALARLGFLAQPSNELLALALQLFALGRRFRVVLLSTHPKSCSG